MNEILHVLINKIKIFILLLRIFKKFLFTILNIYQTMAKQQKNMEQINLNQLNLFQINSFREQLNQVLKVLFLFLFLILYFFCIGN